MSALRVVHVPGRTPYARKLHDDGIQILNGTTDDGLEVPRDATMEWLLAQRPSHRPDVVHLHHPDFEPVDRLRTLLAWARRARVRMVFTAHDLTPVFGDRSTQQRRFRMLVHAGVPFVRLTPTSEQALRRRCAARSELAPHGHVAPPGTRTRSHPRTPGPTRFLLYGSLRTNRDVELVLACWRFARDLENTTLRLLLRAPSRASLDEDAEAWRAIHRHVIDPRLQVDVRPFPNDEDVNDALADSDCLLLPYRWASHSGQLERAADLGVLPVAARVGHLPSQVALHRGLGVEPVWFDWPGDAAYEHGERLLEAMVAAHRAIQGSWHAPDLEAFAAHRQREHLQVLAVHRRLYEDRP